jgi:hypothetical protein
MLKLARPVVVVLALTLASPSAGACDPEDLKTEYRALCATPTDAVLALVEAAAGKLPAERRATLLAKANEAKGLCQSDKYDDAMKLAVRVARALGSAEQEHGLPREQLTVAPIQTRLAQQ